ncbi:DNA repair protein rad5 [Colletotrichum musicola]|uniref:DNA repair protein rad5 n=1 Tax=Colletotrichum musicola TaxID=2175873 RepID=A0A8H6N9E8_9PEZI|nr:DNA repair protein rad5 [Colletotrichum musicola]
MAVPKRSWDSFNEEETGFHSTSDIIDEAEPNNWLLDTVDQPENPAQPILTCAESFTNATLQHEDSCSEEVCFGSVRSLTEPMVLGKPADSLAQLTDVLTKTQRQPEGYSEPDFGSLYSFEIRLMGEYYGMYSSNTLLALLNKTICALLNGLKDTTLIRLKATATLQQWDAGLRDWSRRQGASVLAVDVTIFGAKEEAQSVGEVVAKHGLVLQRPPPQLSHGTSYSNPHYLEISHSSEADLKKEALHASSESVIQDHSQAAEEASVTVDASKEISSILDSLAHRTILREHLAHRRIRSQLHPHQSAAIDYVYRTESENLPPEMSLWRYNDDDEEASYHQHVITGFKSTTPLETTGGIIADEMGLGKSLVMLSIIAGSLDRAASFRDDLLNKRGCGHDRLFPEPSIATLVVVPSSLLIDNWINEIRRHTFPGDMTFFKYHGNKRAEDAHERFRSHIVFTTYSTIASEANRRSNILGNISWFRIVLDEAHYIRNRSTKQFSAVSNLAAHHRWCLTGTPIQNSLEDLGSLAAFLRVPVLENSMTFKRFITGPCTSAVASKRSFEALRTLLASICLRRTRELINLPAPVKETRILELTSLEREQYNTIIFDSKRVIQMAVSKRGNRKVNTAVLLSLLRLRLFCNHGDMTHDQFSQALPTDPDEILSFLQQKDEALCVYCSNIIYAINDLRRKDIDGGFLIKECMHLICLGCMPQFLSEKRQCPQCALGATDRDFESPSADILLMTLGTGAVGLNLAFATRIYLFEPQWNPSIELQAIGRALRLGQSENVTIVRYIMRGTIEDSNVLSRQHKKLQLADGGFSKGGKAISDERLQSLSDIFGVDLEA